MSNANRGDEFDFAIFRIFLQKDRLGRISGRRRGRGAATGYAYQIKGDIELKDSQSFHASSPADWPPCPGPARGQKIFRFVLSSVSAWVMVSLLWPSAYRARAAALDVFALARDIE
jgi:hypothetical protein